MTGEGEGFLADIEPISDIWRFIDLRVLALRESGLGWRCEWLRATLLCERPAPIDLKLPQLSDLFALQEILPVDRLKELIGGLEKGALTVGNDVVHVKQSAGSNVWNPISSYVRAFTREESQTRFGIDWSTVVLHGWGGAGGTPGWHRFRELLDGQLRNSDPPWNGVVDLRRSFLGQPPDEASRYDSVGFNVVAPLMLRFGAGTTVVDSSLQLELECAASVNVREVVVPLFVLSGNEIIARRHVTFGDLEPSVGHTNLRHQELLPTEFSSAACALSYRGRDMDSLQLFGPMDVSENAQWLASQSFVGDPENLLDCLLSVEGGDPFEHAVATLFHLLGLSIVHYGRKTFERGGDMPDMLAFSPSGNWLCVVDPTVRALDLSNKIAKLVTRTNEIRGVMPRHALYPVLVTRQARSEIPETAKKDAMAEKVVLVTRDDFGSLVQLSTKKSTPAMLLGYLARLVPQESGYGH